MTKVEQKTCVSDAFVSFFFLLWWPSHVYFQCYTLYLSLFVTHKWLNKSVKSTDNPCLFFFFIRLQNRFDIDFFLSVWILAPFSSVQIRSPSSLRSGMTEHWSDLRIRSRFVIREQFWFVRSFRVPFLFSISVKN